jgi:hypothetical protein
MREFVYFILGVTVSIPIAIFAPMGTNWMQKIMAQKTETRRDARIRDLGYRLDSVRKYHEDPVLLIRYVAIRVLLITLLWIAQTEIDYIFGLIANSFYYLNNYRSAPINFNAGGNLTNAISSLVDVLILSIILRGGLRAYRLAHHATNFDQYEASINAELAELTAVRPAPSSSTD